MGTPSVDARDRSLDEAEDWRVSAATLSRAPHHQAPRTRSRVAGALILIVVVVGVGHFISRPAMSWPVVAQYMFSGPVLVGIRNTLLMTILSMSLALVVSVVLANMRLSDNFVLRSIAGVYVWFFRSIPLLVLLILWYNIAIVYPRVSMGIPFGPEWWSVDTNQIINGFWAAVLAFGLQQAAYTSEIIRASILAVPKGQREAAAAIGMAKGQILRRIVLPQAMKIAIPPISNDTINLLKATSMAAFIAVPELLYSVQKVYQRTYDVVPLLAVATIWYAVFVSVLSFGQYHLERHLARDTRRLVVTNQGSAFGSAATDSMEARP
jgi:polar amino acid transport system permease protein